MREQTTKVLGTFTLAMMTMAAIVSLRNLSMTAELGFSAVFFLGLAAIVFFIPIALVTAELAAAWPRPGGCYVWVAEAFGKPIGFISLWSSWMASVSWFPTVLAFTATMLAHMLAPVFPNAGLEHNTYFILAIMLLVFWGTTGLNFFGLQISGILSSFGVIIGTLIPGCLIIILGLLWVFMGKSSEIPLTIDSLIPDFKLDNLALFSGVLLGLAGVELAAYHIRETKNPQKSYPLAILFAVILILSVYILGTLAIAIVVPQKELLLASGLVQAFYVFFSSVGLAWMVPLLACLLFLGAMAGIITWIIGPAKGLLVVAQDGFLPKILQQENRFGVPVNLLITQALVASVLAMIFLHLQNNNASIWFLTCLSAQFTFVQYILIFAAALKLRYSQPNITRAFRAPGIWLLSGVGIAVCIFSFAIVYFPHAKLVSIDIVNYGVLLSLCFLVLLSPALIFIRHKI